jgi:hypothetical protein
VIHFGIFRPTVGALGYRFYEHVLGHLQLLGKLHLRAQAWKALRVKVEESRADINFELVRRLAEREERDWTYFGRLRQEREKKLRDPQDVLIEADRLRQQMTKRRAQRRGTQQQYGQSALTRYTKFTIKMTTRELQPGTGICQCASS